MPAPRADSPFRGMSAETFFHEMLAVTFWLLDREIADDTMKGFSKLKKTVGKIGFL